MLAYTFNARNAVKKTAYVLRMLGGYLKVVLGRRGSKVCTVNN